jgi:hypothetical protein
VVDAGDAGIGGSGVVGASGHATGSQNHSQQKCQEFFHVRYPLYFSKFAILGYFTVYHRYFGFSIRIYPKI